MPAAPAGSTVWVVRTISRRLPDHAFAALRSVTVRHETGATRGASRCGAVSQMSTSESAASAAYTR